MQWKVMPSPSTALSPAWMLAVSSPRIGGKPIGPVGYPSRLSFSIPCREMTVFQTCASSSQVTPGALPGLDHVRTTSTT
jgi:hypothetical protein